MDEIAKIAEYFGETLVQVLEPYLVQAMEPALMMVGELQIRCDVLLGEKMQPPFDQEDIVAIGAPGNLVVVPAHGLGLPARRVKRLILRMQKDFAKS